MSTCLRMIMRNLLLLLCLVISANSFANDKLKEATALLNAMNAKESYQVAAEQVKSQMGIKTEKMHAFYERIFSEMALIYSEVYTLEELQGIRAFYESESGKAFLRKKPELTEKYIAILYRLTEEVAQ